jgi:hypothetical protein
MWYNGPPEIQITNAPTGVNALTPSAEIKALQDEANRKADEAKKAAEAWNLTPSQLYEDAQEAFVGILGDLLGLSDRHSVKEIMLHGNRLRGLGIICIALAVAGVLVNWILGAGQETLPLPVDLL